MLMKTFIALFRGINIGGHNMLPMKELVAILQDLGATGVTTYIQSGNAIFRSPSGNPATFAERLTAEIGKRHGFEPYVLIIEPPTLARVIAGNPFPDALNDPVTLHVGFLVDVPGKPDLAQLEDDEQVDGVGERFPPQKARPRSAFVEQHCLTNRVSSGLNGFQALEGPESWSR